MTTEKQLPELQKPGSNLELLAAAMNLPVDAYEQVTANTTLKLEKGQTIVAIYHGSDTAWDPENEREYDVATLEVLFDDGETGMYSCGDAKLLSVIESEGWTAPQLCKIHCKGMTKGVRSKGEYRDLDIFRLKSAAIPAR